MYYIIVDLNNKPHRYTILGVDDKGYITTFGYWWLDIQSITTTDQVEAVLKVKIHDWCKYHNYIIFGTSESHPEYFI